MLQEIDRLVLGPQAARRTLRRDLVIISTNAPLRKDGEPRADYKPTDPGVAVYFTRNKQPVCFACDKYDEIWKNMRAIQKTIEALRGIERWGSSQMMERAFSGFTALPERTGPSCWEILGIEPLATESEIIAAWRDKAKSAHPDAGGNHDAMAALNQAKDIALATIKGV